MVLVDTVDDQIDNQDMAMEDKFHFLESCMKQLFFGESGDFDTKVCPNPLAGEVSLIIADALYSGWFYHDRNYSSQAIYGNLVTLTKAQFVSDNPEEHITFSKEVGAGCVELGAVALEQVEDADYPRIRESARRLGAYIQLLDDAYEIDDDLIEGSKTYATLVIKNEGDTLISRHRVRKVLRTEANNEFARGRSMLTSEQAEIYKVAKALLDIRYKIVKHMQNLRSKFNKGHTALA